MLKVKVVSGVLVLTMALGALTGCGSSKPEAKPAESSKSASAQQANSTGKLVDGVYKVEFDKFDGHDYKAQLELAISGGKITEVKYDEVSKDGKLKSQDAQYKEKMQEGSNTYPEKAYNELKQQLITKQASNIDVISGATASSNNFKALVKYALDDMAKKGNTTPAKIPAPKE